MRFTLLALVAISCALLVPAKAEAVEPDIELFNQIFVCDRQMNGEVVRVIVDASGPGNAINLRDGCTGHFRAEVETAAADGIKGQASHGVHDLTITGYSYQHATSGCGPGGKHADAVQMMGGLRVTFKDFYALQTRCSGAAAFFVNAINDTGPPQNVVCEGCTIARQSFKAAHVNGSTNGVRDSRIWSEDDPTFHGSGFNIGNSHRVAPIDMDALLAEARAGEGSEEPPPPPPPEEDTEAPTAPSNLHIASATDTELVLRWGASTDDVSTLINYRLYLDGVFVGEGCGSSCGWSDQWTYKNLSPGTSYVLGVEAVDEAGNVSTLSLLTASTTGGEEEPPPPPPPEEDPFLDEVQAVEQITHDSSKYPKNRVSEIDSIVHDLSGDTPCADKVERIDVAVHDSNLTWPQDKLEEIHEINHEAGECAV